MKRKPLICAALAACMLLSGCDNIGNILKTQTGIIANNVTNTEAAKQYKTAIINGNIEWIEEILVNNPDLDINYCEDEIALYCSIWNSNACYPVKEKIIDILISAGADPNIGNQLGLTTYNKCNFGTRALLKCQNIDMYLDDGVGNTPLSNAMQNNKGDSSLDGYEQVTMLLGAGAKPYATLFSDTKADLEYATHFVNVDQSPVQTKMLMEMFLNESGGSNIKKGLAYALSGKIGETIEELENNIDDYNEHELAIITRYAAYYGTPEQYENVSGITGVTVTKDFMSHLVESNNLNMVKYLSEKFEIDYSDKNEKHGVSDALNYAAMWGYSDICEYLCSKDFHINDFTSGFKELYSAVHSEDIDTVKVIYKYIKSKYGIDELDIGRAYEAYRPKDEEKAEKIADFFIAEGYSLICVDYSVITYKFADYLYNKGRPIAPSDLTYAVKSNDPEFVKLVLSKGANAEQPAFYYSLRNEWYKNSTGKSIGYNEYISECAAENYKILYTAISESNSEIVRQLIKNGADINTKIENSSAFYNGMTPLHYCIYGSAATLRVLLDAGADINIDCSNIGDKNAKTLAEFYEHNGRSDLAQIVKEYEKK